MQEKTAMPTTLLYSTLWYPIGIHLEIKQTYGTL